MLTEDLISQLSDDLRPVRRRSAWREAAILVAVLAIEALVYAALGDVRSDMHLAMALAGFWWKAVGVALLTGMAILVSVRSYDPVLSARSGLRWLAALAALVFVAGWLVDAGSGSGATMAARLAWRHGLDCVTAIVMLSAPAFATLAWFMRRGAPTDRESSALASGLAAALAGALVFVLNCPHDDPLYVACWFTVGVALVTAVAQLVLPRIARW